jgi:hypothetical protein
MVGSSVSVVAATAKGGVTVHAPVARGNLAAVNDSIASGFGYDGRQAGRQHP